MLNKDCDLIRNRIPKAYLTFANRPTPAAAEVNKTSGHDNAVADTGHSAQVRT